MTKEQAERLVKYVFNGQEIHNLEGSLYQVGTKHVVIVSREETYFLGLNIYYLSKAEYVIVLCWNDWCAFLIPTKTINSLPFSKSKSGNRYVTSVTFNDAKRSWMMTFNKCEKGSSIPIDEYKINLREPKELEEYQRTRIIGRVLALRKLLKIDEQLEA